MRKMHLSGASSRVLMRASCTLCWQLCLHLVSISGRQGCAGVLLASLIRALVQIMPWLLSYPLRSVFTHVRGAHLHLLVSCCAGETLQEQPLSSLHPAGSVAVEVQEGWKHVSPDLLKAGAAIYNRAAKLHAQLSNYGENPVVVHTKPTASRSQLNKRSVATSGYSAAPVTQSTVATVAAHPVAS